MDDVDLALAIYDGKEPDEALIAAGARLRHVAMASDLALLDLSLERSRSRAVVRDLVVDFLARLARDEDG